MNEDERAIADVWSSVLHCEANELFGGSAFFDRGGDSLSAMRAMALLSERVGRDLPLSALFQHTTVSALAAFIGDVVALRQASSVSRVPIVRVADAERRYELSFAQERFWFLDQLFPGGSEVSSALFSSMAFISLC
jgi:acyl carrier protein